MSIISIGTVAWFDDISDWVTELYKESKEKSIVTSYILKNLIRKCNEKKEENKSIGEKSIKIPKSAKHFDIPDNLNLTTTSDSDYNDCAKTNKSNKKRPKRRRGNMSIDFMNS